MTIRVLIKQKKAVFISFSFNISIETADDDLGDIINEKDNYIEEVSLLKGISFPEVEDYLKRNGYENIVLDSNMDNLFYGIGTYQRKETQNQAMEKVLNDYKQDNPYRTLFDLRLKIQYLQKVYSIEKHPKAIVRFFGLFCNGSVVLFLPVFSQSYYLEKK